MLTAEIIYSRRFNEGFANSSSNYIRKEVLKCVLNNTMLSGSAFNRAVRNIKESPSITEIIDCCHSYEHLFTVNYLGVDIAVDVDGFNSQFCFLTAISPAETPHGIDKLINYHFIGMKAFLAMYATGCNECYLIHIQSIYPMDVKLVKITLEQLQQAKIKLDSYLYKNDLVNENRKRQRDSITSNFTLLPHLMEMR